MLAVVGRPKPPRDRRAAAEIEPADKKDMWWGRFALAREIHLVTRTGYPLPPEISVSLDITLRNPLEDDFAFKGTCGSAC
jgi:hypothetical protein